ncbi:MAG: ammonium permease, partial [Cyanobacteria bacterium J06598_3]
YDATKNIFIGKEDPARFEEHNLSLATLGCLILWLGWFGFNGGSTTRLEYIPHILTTTFFSAAAGGIGAVIFSPFITDRKARLSAIINGILGGLVGITAASAYVSIGIAIVIGASSGLLVVVATKALNRWRIDDPVGAVPVHLVCGGWGTIAVGLFASPSSNEYQLENYSRLTQIFYQTLGWTTIVAVVSVLSLIAWLAVGCMLYALSPKTEIIRQARKERVRRNFSPSPWTIGLVPFVLHISRQGLRVPLSLEEKGGTPTLLP